MKKIVPIILIIAGTCFGQATNPDVIIKNLKEAFSKVKDYSVDADIKVDASFIKVPEMKAKIFYKQPDKTHIQSTGFAMIPRKGLDFSPASIFKGKYTSFYVKEDIIDNIKTSVIKIIPLEDNGEVILSTLWVDQSNNVIRKIESSTKTNGTFVINLSYDFSLNKYPLPSSITFSFDVGRMNFAPRNEDSPGMAGEKKPAKNITGKVFITYSNYIVNKGIPDKVFEEKEK